MAVPVVREKNFEKKRGSFISTENRHNESDMIDAHAHVHDAAFDGDRDLVVERAQSAGVEALVTIGTDIFESRQAVACAERYSVVWASVGIHPHIFDGIEDEGVLSESIVELKGIAESSRKVVAIGECGLDYFSPDDTGTVISERRKNMQKSGFLAQVSLARELSFPVIVHTRPSFGSMDAYEDVYSLLKSSSFPGQNHPSVVLHCYMGDVEMTEKFLNLSQVFFSFAGNITYKARIGSYPERVLGMVPLDRVIAETDCPYLTPIPYRGKRNEPAHVVLVAKHIAETKKIPYTSLEGQLRRNIQMVFPKMSNE